MPTREQYSVVNQFNTAVRSRINVNAKRWLFSKVTADNDEDGFGALFAFIFSKRGLVAVVNGTRNGVYIGMTVPLSDAITSATEAIPDPCEEITKTLHTSHESVATTLGVWCQRSK